MAKGKRMLLLIMSLTAVLLLAFSYKYLTATLEADAWNQIGAYENRLLNCDTATMDAFDKRDFTNAEIYSDNCLRITYDAISYIKSLGGNKKDLDAASLAYQAKQTAIVAIKQLILSKTAATQDQADLFTQLSEEKADEALQITKDLEKYRHTTYYKRYIKTRKEQAMTTELMLSRQREIVEQGGIIKKDAVQQLPEKTQMPDSQLILERPSLSFG